MPNALVYVEILGVALLVLVVVFVVATYARRRTISHGRLLMLCGWREDRANRWRLGHLRLGSSRLEWFSLLGLSTRPQHGWDRVRLDLDAPGQMAGADRIDLLPDAAPVHCTYGDRTFELALTPGAYTAVRSWAEAAPPGAATNVA